MVINYHIPLLWCILYLWIRITKPELIDFLIKLVFYIKTSLDKSVIKYIEKPKIKDE